MNKQNQVFFAAAFLLLLTTSCSVSRLDRCKTTPSSCPGLIGRPSSGPRLLSLTPDSQSLSVMPTTVVATFDQPMEVLTADKFALGGTCTVPPTVSGVAMSADQTVATASLTASTCANAQELSVTLTPSALNNADGLAGEGAAVTQTYTMVANGPTLTLAAPSQLRLGGSVTSSTIALTYTDAVATTLTNADITKNETGASCTVNVSGVSPAGATLTVSACTGDGTIRVSVNAGTATDADGNLASASAPSQVITIDHTGPSITGLTPATSTVVAAPTSVVATFNEAVKPVQTADFVLSGTCSVLPTVSGVAMSVSDTTATATLTGGTCTDTQTLVVRLRPSDIEDLLGNAGTGADVTRTYTINTSGPTATLAAPSRTRIRSSGTSTIALTYHGANATTLTNAGITKNETGATCTVNVSGASAAGATLTVSGCSGDGTLTVTVNAGTATNSLGNPSSASAASAVITVDNTGPTLVSVTPGSGSMNTLPTQVTATFSEGMTTVSTSAFFITGTCSTLPMATSVAMSVGDTVATAQLSAAVCSVGQYFKVSVEPEVNLDIAGNQGYGPIQDATYTKINGTAVLAITGNANLGDASCGDVSSTFTVTNNGNAAGTITDVIITAGPFYVSADTCYLAVLAPGGTCMVEVTSVFTSSGSGDLSIDYDNQQSNVNTSRTLTVSSPGC